MNDGVIDDWLQQLVRPAIRDKKPYTPARDGLDNNSSRTVHLNMNESPYSFAGSQTNRYGAQQPQLLREAIAFLYDVSIDHLLLTRGSTEGIDTLVRVFCRENIDNVLICPPTYGYYRDAAQSQGAKVISIPLVANKDYQLDVDGILKAVNDQTKIIFIPSPNNPLGHPMETCDILALCEARWGKSIIAVDEAYIEFSNDRRGLSTALAEHHNLVILRTFSKAYGLAGDRVGSLLGHPQLIEMAQKTLPSFMFSPRVVEDALCVTSDSGSAIAADNRTEILLERWRLAENLARSADVERVFPSSANFVTVRVKNGDEVGFLNKAATAGFELRGCGTHGLPGCVRITVGTPAENTGLIKAFVEPSEISLGHTFRRSAVPAILSYWDANGQPSQRAKRTSPVQCSWRQRLLRYAA